jgi:hypothetical protein
MVWKSLLCSIESFAQDFQKFIERSRGLESRCRSEANILKALLNRLNSLENDTVQVCLQLLSRQGFQIFHFR